MSDGRYLRVGSGLGVRNMNCHANVCSTLNLQVTGRTACTCARADGAWARAEAIKLVRLTNHHDTGQSIVDGRYTASQAIQSTIHGPPAAYSHTVLDTR